MYEDEAKIALVKSRLASLSIVRVSIVFLVMAKHREINKESGHTLHIQCLLLNSK